MNVTLIGTGLLGRAVAERLHQTGRSVTVYNRTRSRAEPLKERGLRVAGSCKEAVESSDTTFLLLADAPAIRSVLFGKDAPDLVGRIVIQMGTIAPEESRSLRETIVRAGGEYCEAPVLGSVTEARSGALLLLFGGTDEQFTRLRDLFHSLATSPAYIGPVGKAAALKLALNQLIAAEIAAFSLSLGLVRQEDVDVSLFMKILRESALYAPTYDKKLPRLLERDYTNPNFSTRHMLKDVRLILDEAEMHRLSTGGLAGLVPLLSRSIDQGLGDNDYSALYDVIHPPRRATESQ
ncbi:MAG TPA: NAD(P)-dependent oxidoreductase [Nitrospiraceae bacterium]|nr:NAD(P)-dependent oxidoreductase [Nitrospiraceae bacterium]